ncbi:lysophospholipid acyltransferase family protein [Crenothrix polyspora]|jgi:1-acyl-sn-glycerol-3-phosphate acyltransferase|uniref:Phospholipid/glycerol acyltransferase n=1 Tax=Crenothrix polyspora TaxID=360316 RepID=A0A1R4HJ39_9GAMM|nr:lysophospholipid acyltransferase family protein [Crenothrix polyspora]SJM96246.1 Phospholipid/glycerol acyltransferase [Crenothrix polyspora]
MTQQDTSAQEDFRPKNLIGSILLFIGIFTTATVIGILLITGLIFNFAYRWYIGRLWCLIIGWFTRVCCGLSFEVEGLENIDPKQPVIFFSNHQSAWETLALRVFLPPHSVVIKKELLYFPIWGWSLLTLKSIVINRKNQRASLKSLLEQGTRYLNEGLSVLIFPEGTRSAPGTVNKFNIGGAMLAQKTGYPVIPLVHNAGDFWPRYSFYKYPGVIKVKIGTMIETKNRKAQDINAEAEAWIRRNLQNITASSPD